MNTDVSTIVDGIINFNFSAIIHGVSGFLNSSDFFVLLSWIKVIFISISLFFVGIIIYAIKDGKYIRALFWTDVVEFFTYRPYGSSDISKDWKGVKKRLKSGQGSEYKLAIIEADIFLNDVLKKMGYKGETLGEILESITLTTFYNIAEIKSAHNVRNNIIHDPNYTLTLENAEKTIFAYEEALIAVEAI